MIESEWKMSVDDQHEAVLECLRSAHTADPTAIAYLMSGVRIGCTDSLADHPHVVVGDRSVGGPDVGALGVLNGCLAAAGICKVAAVVDDDGKLTGFCSFTPKGPQ